MKGVLGARKTAALNEVLHSGLGYHKVPVGLQEAGLSGST